MKKRFTILLIITTLLGLIPINVNAVNQNQLNAEVQIVCPDNYGNWWSGSGTIIDPKGIILTNKHVVKDPYGGIIKYCFVGFIDSISDEPNFGTTSNPNYAETKYYTTSSNMDAAILYLNNPANENYPYVDIWNSDSNDLDLGDKIEVIGFPGTGGSTITYTEGTFSGFGSKSINLENYIKASVPIDHGNSGGAAYSANKFIGIPTLVIKDINTISYILSINSIKAWLLNFLGYGYKEEIIEQQPAPRAEQKIIQNDTIPPDITRVKVEFIESSTNKVLPQGQPNSVPPNKIKIHLTMPKDMLDDLCWQWYAWYPEVRTDYLNNPFQMPTWGCHGKPGGALYTDNQFFTPVPERDNEGEHYLTVQLFDTSGNASELGIWKYEYKKPQQEIKVDNNLLNRLKGYILLQVEENGEAWYVNPTDGKRYYMKDGSTAYQMMRNFGLGITNADLAKVPQENEKNNYPLLVNRLKGKILLQVEEHGEAWYVNPKTGYRHYMKDGQAAYNLMRFYSLGISNQDLEKIPVGTL